MAKNFNHWCGCGCGCGLPVFFGADGVTDLVLVRVRMLVQLKIKDNLQVRVRYTILKRACGYEENFKIRGPNK